MKLLTTDSTINMSFDKKTDHSNHKINMNQI